MDGKKTFLIEINGLKESYEEIVKVNEALQDLDKLAEQLKSKEIKIKVSTEGTKPTEGRTTVRGNTTSVEDKTALQIEKEKAKAIALTNDEYRQQLAELEALKAANKENEKLIKQQQSGVKDLGGEYANTLAGQRALLSDLKKELANTELGTEEWDELQQKVKEVNDYVKELEYSYGVFQRNVGNYPQSMGEGFVVLADGTKKYSDTINGLSSKLKDLETQLNDLEVGSDAFNETTQAIKDTKQQLNELKAAAEVAGNAMEAKLGVGFTATIEGIDYTFDDVNQGIGLLEDKLYSMAAAGDTTSDTFKAISEKVVELKNVVKQTDAAIDNMVGTSKGLRNTLSIVTGFTGIASLGQGLLTLFGGQNEELDKSLQKFAALSMILQGLQNIQQQLMDKTSMFTKVFGTLNNGVSSFVETVSDGISTVSSKLAKGLGLSKVSEEIGNLFDDLKHNFEVIDLFNDITDSYMQHLDEFLGFTRKYTNEISAAWERLGYDAEDLRYFLTNIYAKGSEGTDFALFDQLKEELGDLGEDFEAAFDKFDEHFRNLETIDLYGGNEEPDEFLSKLIDFSDEHPKIMAAFRGISNGIGSIIKGFKAATVALKGFAKATIILAVVQLAVEALSKLFEMVGKAIDWATGKTDKIDKSFDHLSATLETVQNRLNLVNKEIDRLEGTGAVSTIEALDMKMEALSRTVLEAGNNLKNFIEELGDAEKIDISKDYTDTWFSDSSSKDMDEFRRKYETLVKAVQKGIDEVEASGEGSFLEGWYKTAEDAKSDLVGIQEALLKDIEYQISQIDFSKGEEAYRQFLEVINDETNASVLANIDGLFKDDLWQQGLKKRIDSYKQFAEQMYDLNTQILTNDRNLIKQIEDNNIQAIQQRFKQEEEQMKLNRKRELDDARGNAELIDSINRKYDTLDLNRRKNMMREIRSIDRQIADNYIAAMDDSLEKRVKEIESSRQSEIDSAKDSEINVAEQIKSINAKYDRQIADAKEQWYKEREASLKEHNKAMLQIETDYQRDVEDIQRQIEERRMQTKFADLETRRVDMGVELTFDDNNLDDMELYYSDMLSLEKEYIDEKRRLQLEESQKKTEYDLSDEKRRYDDLLATIKENYRQQQESLSESLKNGSITQEEYLSIQKRNTEAYNSSIEDAERQHTEMMEAINLQGMEDMKRITNESLQERKNATVSSLNERLNAYSDFYDRVSSLSERNSLENINSFGLINVSKERKNLNDTLDAYKEVIDGIKRQKEELQQGFERGEISFNDFRTARKELESLEDDVSDSVKETQKNLDNFSMAVAQNVAGVISNYMNQLSSLYSTFNDIMMTEYDNQQAELDRQREFLEKEEEQLEESYQKQQEITEKYTDKINGIEDELKDARGERRQYLIDQLAQQREAQLEALKAEQDIASKQQENKKKEEALAAKEDALDKKRKNQQKKLQIVQATVNTATAVTNALAVQPWFVGVALAAVAAAMGAVQISKIKAAKYAEGGELVGRSHAQGGIKVLGGMAEVEGGEFITNKTTTKNNKELLYYTNSIKRTITRADMEAFFNSTKKVKTPEGVRKFEDGGELPTVKDFNLRETMQQRFTDDRPIVVSVVDIINRSDNVRKVRTLAGL